MYVALLVTVSLAVAGTAFATVSVRVLLADISAPGEVSIGGPHRGFVDGAPRFDTPFGLTWPFHAEDGRLIVDGADVGSRLAIEPGDEGFAFAGSRYRGAVTLTARGNVVRVINVLPLEAYLRGVVPAEMHAAWPLEALKAQAIAARSYTITSLDPNGAYDICATIDCQVYHGRDAEHPRADVAIAETEGLVLTHGGRFARTYYHADSGGTVASSAEVWGMAAPYLIAVQDVSTASPHRRWRFSLDPKAIRNTALGAGRDVGVVTTIRVVAYSESGRATSIEVTGTGGTIVLSGHSLRDSIRSWGLKSTRFKMVGDLLVEGDGWGHGVGMSQYGARALAAAGYAHWQILGFYYPGTSLQRLP